MTGPGPDGVAVIDKAPGWTSHDVVAKARGVLGTRKVGHSGTLDPDATGVLVLGVGRVTRLLRFLTAAPKSYVGEVVLGASTTTLDSSGDVVEHFDMSEVTAADVNAAAARLVGAIEQVPPMVSAVKIGGRRLHQLAREGTVVDRPPRRVTVHSLTTAPTAESGVYRIEVACSSGTYVRTLADDLGRLLGGGAHLRNLRRTSVGSFTLDEARPVEEAELLAPEAAVRDLDAVSVDDALARAIGHGRVIPRHELGVVGEGPWAVLGPSGHLLAVYEPRGADDAKPAVVLAVASPPLPPASASP